jgi:hypothetical protein
MKRIILALTAVVVALVFGAVARADATPPPFPGPVVKGVFVAAQTVTTTGQVGDFFAPGDTVVFQAYALDTKLHQMLTKKTSLSLKKYLQLPVADRKAAQSTLRSFYVRIPLMSPKSFPLTFTKAPAGVNGLYRWTASWKVPTLYPLGVVHFQVFAKTWANRTGSFMQMPIAASQLTISTTPTQPIGAGPAISGAYSANTDVALFVDAVNAFPPQRPVGCTQTNVFKIGEKIVMRAYGYDLFDGSVLSMANVTDAHFSIPGAPDTLLNWGAHGATGAKVYYWTGAWAIPADYPLGDVSVHVSYTTAEGKTGTLDYPITIIPAT